MTLTFLLDAANGVRPLVAGVCVPLRGVAGGSALWPRGSAELLVPDDFGAGVTNDGALVAEAAPARPVENGQDGANAVGDRGGLRWSPYAGFIILAMTFQ